MKYDKRIICIVIEIFYYCYILMDVVLIFGILKNLLFLKFLIKSMLMYLVLFVLVFWNFIVFGFRVY